MFHYKNTFFREIYQQTYNFNSAQIHNHAKDNIHILQRLGLIKNLPLHQGCVNTLCWNEKGSLLLSGSDDQHLIITDGYTYKMRQDYRTSHRANIFSAKFMPVSQDHNVVSCSGDGIILYTDLERPSETYYNQFNCHSGTTYEVITVPYDPNIFLSCGEDGTVRCFDLRIKTRCKKPRCKEDILVIQTRAVSALSINPTAPFQLAMGSSDSTVRIYDRRMMHSTGYSRQMEYEPMCSFTVPELEDRAYRITSLSFSPDGHEILVSYSSDHLYLFTMKDQTHMKLVKDIRRSKEKSKIPAKRVKKSPPPVRRLRLRGDWSDTGPDARPERDSTSTVMLNPEFRRLSQKHNAEGGGIGQARPQLQATLMERMTNVLFRMLNDPLTRAALSAGGEDSLETNSSSELSQDQGQEAMSQDDVNMDETTNEVEDSTSGTDHSSMYVDGDSTRSTRNATTPSSSNPNNDATSTASEDDPPPMPSESSQAGNSLNELHNQFSNLRHGFIEKHGTEPSVNLRYSDQSSTNSTIKLSMGHELTGPASSDSFGAFPFGNVEASTSGYVASTSTNASTENSSENSTNSNDLPKATCQDCKSTLSQATASKPTSSGIGTSVTATSGNQNRFQTENRPSTSCDKVFSIKRPNEFGDRLSTKDMIRTQILEADDYSDSDDEKNEIVEEDVDGYEAVLRKKYVGHRNARTMIKEATFWGNNYVMSGSDCGHVFVWDRDTANVVMLLQADHHVVNCLQPHPVQPILATSGIDHDIKIWAPIHEEASFDPKITEDLIQRNEIMLEETRDTITVPAAFMIRMLACLNQIRRTGSLQRSRRHESDPNIF